MCLKRIASEVFSMNKPNEIDDLKQTYQQLSYENKKYIQAVANALKFSQDATEKSKPQTLDNSDK